MSETPSLQELIADYHHDFRSVLTNLTGYVDHLLEGAGGPLTPIQEESLQVILKNAHRLRLMADNLARATSEEGVLSVPREPFDLRKVVGRSVRLFALSARDAGLVLDSNWEGESFVVPGSELLLGSLVDNLLSNAIKFTPPGGKVTTLVKASKDDVALVIDDTGMGIPREDLSRIFERGFKGSRSGSGRREGLGLGLSICRRIAEAHGVRIEVESQEGRGTRFQVVFPLVGARSSK